MSLDNIQLPAITLEQLFKKSLVALKSSQTEERTRPGSSLSVLGKNEKRITIAVNNREVAFLPDDELNFLLGVLAACNLNMDDVCILNIRHNAGADYRTITNELKAEKIFLFGAGSSDIALPLSFPHYQVQPYNKQVYLSAPALSELQNDKAEKTKLWKCLKQIFSI